LIVKEGVVIVGGKAGSKIAYDIFRLRGISVLGFMDNYVESQDWGDIDPVLLGSSEEPENIGFIRQTGVDYFVATGDNEMRRANAERLRRRTGKAPANAIHPSTIISEYASMKSGNLVCAGAVINIGARIGECTIINTGAIVEHDVTIEDFAQVSPHASLAGYVTVCGGAFVSTGATVIPGVRIGRNAVVAAGAAVIGDVADHTMVAGVPAVYKKKC